VVTGTSCWSSKTLEAFAPKLVGWEASLGIVGNYVQKHEVRLGADHGKSLSAETVTGGGALGSWGGQVSRANGRIRRKKAKAAMSLLNTVIFRVKCSALGLFGERLGCTLGAKLLGYLEASRNESTCSRARAATISRQHIIIIIIVGHF